MQAVHRVREQGLFHPPDFRRSIGKSSFSHTSVVSDAKQEPGLRLTLRGQHFAARERRALWARLLRRGAAAAVRPFRSLTRGAVTL